MKRLLLLIVAAVGCYGQTNVTWTTKAIQNTGETTYTPGFPNYLNILRDPVSGKLFFFTEASTSNSIYSTDVFFYKIPTNQFTYIAGAASAAPLALDDPTACAASGTSTAPHARHPISQMSVDTKRGFLWLTGGVCSGATQGSMYYLTLHTDPTLDTWTQVTPGAFPPGPMDEAAIAYDPDDDVQFWFGYDVGSDIHDQWVYCSTIGTGELTAAQMAVGCTSGDTWIEVNSGSSHPPGSSFPAMVWSPVIHQFITYGGTTSGGTPQNQTWTYAPKTQTWAQKALSTTPPPVLSASSSITALTYVAATDKVFFHQATGTGAPADWIYDPLETVPASAWTKITTIGTGSATTSNTIAYDPGANLVVSFGGSGGIAELMQGALGGIAAVSAGASSGVISSGVH